MRSKKRNEISSPANSPPKKLGTPKAWAFSLNTLSKRSTIATRKPPKNGVISDCNECVHRYFQIRKKEVEVGELVVKFSVLSPQAFSVEFLSDILQPHVTEMALQKMEWTP